MSDALVFEFSGVSAHDYGAVNAILGLDPTTGDGLWPAGLLSHTGAAGSDGGFVVFEVWESQESQAAWMASRLGPALSKGWAAGAETGPVADRRGALQRLSNVGSGTDACPACAPRLGGGSHPFPLFLAATLNGLGRCGPLTTVAVSQHCSRPDRNLSVDRRASPPSRRAATWQTGQWWSGREG